MKALIIEDEIFNYNDLRDMLTQAYPQMEISEQVSNLADMERMMLSQHEYDVVYCDIRLEDGLCFSVLEQMEVTVPIIFTTAYSEFALKAFEVNGIAYLLKPIKDEALRKATDKALKLSESLKGKGKQPDSTQFSSLLTLLSSLKPKIPATYIHYLKARTYDGSYIIDIAEVSHFVLEDGDTYAMMQDGKKNKIEYSLDTLSQKLDQKLFFRANRQCIVSRHAIYRIRTYDSRRLVIKLTAYPNEQIILSKETAALLDKWIEQ